MPDLIKYLSIVLPVIFLMLVVLILGFNLYFKVRRKFPITVNCWFCNSWIKVSYDDKNNFKCIVCHQYNGFNKDGGYNKIIPAQHDELLNKRTNQIKSKKIAKSNGLCMFCNNNQQLKIFQLANFVPLNEDNYDIEIEHFQKQLENAYKLCKKCDKVLKSTIEKQNTSVLGRQIKNLGKNGLSLLNSNKTANKTQIRIFLTKLIKLLLISISILILLHNVFAKINFLTNLISKYIPNSTLQLAHIKIIKNYVDALNVNIKNSDLINKYLSFYFEYYKNIPIYLSISGLFLHLILIIANKFPNTLQINQFLSWTILSLTFSVLLNKKFSLYIYFLQMFCALYLFLGTRITDTSNKNNPEKSQTKRKSVRKFVKNFENTYSDLSNDFEDVASNCSNKIQETSSQYSSDTISLSSCNFSNSNKIIANNDLNKPNAALDLNKSLNNLNLGPNPPQRNPNQFLNQFPTNRPKPVLSPSKFNNFTQNSWVAGGFWRDSNGLVFPINRQSNISRSSSQSSGFESQTNFNSGNNFHSNPSSRAASTFGDFERCSMISEPTYHFGGNSFGYRASYFQNENNLLYYRSENAFYPVLGGGNGVLFMQGGKVYNQTFGNHNFPSLQNSFVPVSNNNTSNGGFVNNEPRNGESLFKVWPQPKQQNKFGNSFASNK